MVNTKAGETADQVYRDLYKLGLYPERWFHWQGKPLLICDPREASDEVRRFFTLRKTHWPFSIEDTAAKTIKLDGGFEPWSDVGPDFADHAFDNDHRDFGRDEVHYTNSSGATTLRCAKRLATRRISISMRRLASRSHLALIRTGCGC